LIYDNDSYFNQLSLYEEKTILPLKEFIIRKYFDEKAKIRTESEEAHQSKTSLGFKYPEHAVVEVSDKTKSLGFKNPERAVVEVSDKILIDTGATSCYIRRGIYKNKNELPIYKRVSTVNG